MSNIEQNLAFILSSDMERMFVRQFMMQFTIAMKTERPEVSI